MSSAERQLATCDLNKLPGTRIHIHPSCNVAKQITVAKKVVDRSGRSAVSISDPSTSQHSREVDGASVRLESRVTAQRTPHQMQRQETRPEQPRQQLTVASDKEASEHDWQKPRRKRRWRQQIVSGTRIGANGLSGLSEKVYDLYISGCISSTTVDTMRNYCVGSLNISPKDICEVGSNNRWIKSYKISVTESERDCLLKPECWPRGVSCRKWYSDKKKV